MMDTDQLLISQFFKEHKGLAIRYIESLNDEEIVSLIADLTIEQNSILFSKLNIYRAAQILEKVTVEKTGIILSSLSTLVAQSLLRGIKKNQREAILNQIEPEKATTLRRGLEYSKDRVGAHIEPFVHTLSCQMTIENGLESINNSTSNVQPHFFVLDEKNKMTGYVELNHLIQGEKHLKIKTIQRPVKQPALADMSIDDLLDRWDHTLVYLPVVDVDGIFIGSVSRAVLSEMNGRKTTTKVSDNAAVKAGNALGDLYMIGLTSLLGSPTEAENNA